MSARSTIFDSIRHALGSLPSRAAYPVYDSSMAEPTWLAGISDLEYLFAEKLILAGGRFFPTPSACAQWLKADGTTCLYLDPVLAELTPSFAEAGLEITSEYNREKVDRIDAAVTLATAAIAESATIVLTDAVTTSRLSALAPWRHIAAIPRSSLHRSIGDAVAMLPNDPNVVWVTGPSKTADVEGILIQGVHGPGEQGGFFLER